MAYRIVSIEGEGDAWRGVKLADDLVRSSRIFWHLCKKIQRAKSVAGTQKYHRLKQQDKLKEAELALKTATKSFEKHIREIEKKARLTEERLLKKALQHQEAEKEALQKVKEAKVKLFKLKSSYNGNMFTKNRRSKKLESKLVNYKQYINFFSRPLPLNKSWYNSNEAWIRYTLAMEDIKIREDLNNVDYFILLSSLYFNYITVAVLANRSGWHPQMIQKSLRKLVAGEYLYREGIMRYFPTHKCIAVAKNISHKARQISESSYFTENTRPKQIIK